MQPGRSKRGLTREVRQAMREGLLWFDDDKSRSLAQKVERAARHYRMKYDRRPTVCYVHSSTLDGCTAIGEMKVEPLSTVLRHHFWIGEEVEGYTTTQQEDK
jgi:hypothetical protein